MTEQNPKPWFKFVVRDVDVGGVEIPKLTRLLNQEELDALLNKYSLEWVNIYWEAPNGLHGAMARSVGPQTLSELQSELRAQGDLAVTGSVAGSYYFTVAEMTLTTLQAVDQEGDVLLVDVGPLDQRDAAVRSGSCVIFALPDPLWYGYVNTTGVDAGR